jgi:threonine dehydrogenase-like Zn-dependent dehydrogenase
MKALVLKDYKIRLDEIEIPRRQKNESLIKVHLAGICNTDIELTKGYMGFEGVLGHEFVGTVEESNTKELMNKRVVGEINLGCGNCSWCLSGMSRHCPNRTVLGIDKKDGVMAEFVTLPDENLHIIPDNVSNEQAVFTEPIAAAFEILEQVHFPPGKKVLLFGDGKLGQLIARVLYSADIDLLVVGKNNSKLQLLNNLGIKSVLIKALKAGEYPIVIEATGSAEGFLKAVEYTEPRGTLILKSTIADKSGMNLAPVVVKEITIVGSRCGPFKPALKALELNKIKTNDLITDTFQLNDAEIAFQQAIKKQSLKVLLKVFSD